MVEINHSGFRNFFPPSRFQLLGSKRTDARQETARNGPPDSLSSEQFAGIEGVLMRYFKYVAVLAVLMVPLAYSRAQVSVGIGVGPVGVVVGHPYVAGPSVCEYGYYGASYFVNGVFIGAGPWYHGYHHRDWDRGGWRHEGWNHAYAGHGWGYRHDGQARGYAREGYSRAYAGGHGRGYVGGGHHRGNNFHDGGGSHSVRGFHGGHGGGRR